MLALDSKRRSYRLSRNVRSQQQATAVLRPCLYIYALKIEAPSYLKVIAAIFPPSKSNSRRTNAPNVKSYFFGNTRTSLLFDIQYCARIVLLSEITSYRSIPCGVTIIHISAHNILYQIVRSHPEDYCGCLERASHFDHTTYERYFVILCEVCEPV
jgi:hypothetical protein